MIVKVLYFAELKEITGKEEEEFDLSIHNLKNLVDLLINKYHRFNEIIWDEKLQKLNNNISIIINTQPIHGENILTKQLNEEDIIAFLLPISGG
ncbi:MAG: MoaD/ThiS family protein [Promethearchaeota archaeon]